MATAASAGCVLKEIQSSSTQVAAKEPTPPEDVNCSSGGEEEEAQNSSSDEEDEGCRYYKVEEPEGTIIYEHFMRKVIRHGDKVTKINRRGISPAEVAAMRFVREHTTIPVPRIYATTPATITMEYVEGATLEEAWNELSDDERAVISDQLRDYIGQLRSIKGTYIGGFENGLAIDGRRFIHEGGPFTTEAEWNDFLLSNLLAQCPDALQSVVRSQMRTDHDVVLTHGDLVGKNIIVRHGRIASIIDWERAGFYPEYYELIKLLRGPNWRVGYYSALLDIFPRRYEPEYLIDQWIGRVTRH